VRIPSIHPKFLFYAVRIRDVKTGCFLANRFLVVEIVVSNRFLVLLAFMEI